MVLRVFRKAHARIVNNPVASETLLDKQSFNFTQKEIYKEYQLILWLTQNYPSLEVPVHYSIRLNKLHGEYRMKILEITSKRGYIWFALVFLAYNMMPKYRYDWQDMHDPKFEQKLYGDLEEGSDEGGDDD
ncbi:hypothetical protein pb186bvf_009751 [Paramecium bursaria]